MLAQILVSSVTAGAVYALIALGFVLIYKGTGLVHFGYGEQATLGAYMVLIMQRLFELPFWVAVGAALLFSGVFGALIFLIFAGPLRKASLWTKIIATLAIGMALREALRAYMGPNAWPFPFLLSPDSMFVQGIYIVPADLAIVGVVLIILAALFLFLEKTLPGKAILAACGNAVGASLVGVNVSRIFLFIWIVASLLATVAGILIAPQLTLSPDMGIIAIKGFTAAVLGGFTSLPGAVLGGIILGLLEGLAGAYISSALKDLITYSLLILAMVFMPRGIFGRLTVKKV